PANSHQAMQRARQLSAITGAEFGVPQRQIAIRMLGRLVHADVERTVHRLQTKLDLFQLSWREHHVRVVLFVTADAPQLTLSDMRRVNQSVTALRKFR